jgi:hypothetical protein
MKRTLALERNENEEVRGRRKGPRDSQDLEEDNQGDNFHRQSQGFLEKITSMPSSHPWMSDGDDDHGRYQTRI